MHRYLDETPALLEMLSDIEIVYTDLDGTLLGSGGTLLVDGKGTPSVATAEAILALRALGIPCVPVSGRSSHQMVEIVRMVGWEDFIAEAGCVRSYWTGITREYEFDLPEWDKSLLVGDTTPLDLIHRSGALDALMAEFPGAIEHHAPWHLRRDASDVLRGYIDMDRAREILSGLSLPIELIENGAINPKLHGLSNLSGPIHAYHLAPAGCSKARGISLDLAKRGIDPSRALMIGDGSADLKCASSVGVLLLVENALRSPSVENTLDGVANAALVRGHKGDGWVDFANQLIASR